MEVLLSQAIHPDTTGENIILLKIASNGAIQWKKYFDFTDTEYGYSVQQTSDGGFIVTGRTYAEIFLLKTASDGSLQWAKTFGGSYSQEGKCVRQTSDGGFIITGFTNFGAGDYDVYLIKTDLNGTLQWTKTYGGTNSDLGNAVQQTSDEGYIIAGTTSSYGAGLEDVYLIKTASDGTLQWTKTFGGNLREEGNSVQQTKDGGFIVNGSTNSYGMGSDDVYLVKTDSNGTLQWSKTYGGTGYEFGYSVSQTNDAGFIIIGNTTSSFATYSSDIYLIKTDSNGNSGCNETSPISIQGSGGIEGSGGAQGTGCSTGEFSYIVADAGSHINGICSNVGINEGLDHRNNYLIYPNPFYTQTILKTSEILKDATLTMYNAYGQTVKQIKNISGQTIILNRDNLPSGLYFICITQDTKTLMTEKLVITDN